MEEAQHPNQVDMSQQGTPELDGNYLKSLRNSKEKKGKPLDTRWYLESSSDKGC